MSAAPISPQTREVEALEQAAIAATREAEIHTESEIRATAEAIAVEEGEC